MAKAKKDLHVGDKVFYWILKTMAFGIILLLVSFFLLLLKMSWPVLSKMGPSFFGSTIGIQLLKNTVLCLLFSEQ